MEERNFVKANLEYMMEKLNIEKSVNTLDKYTNTHSFKLNDQLPAPMTLRKILGGGEVTSETIKKLVRFYNANLTPEITYEQFTKSYLADLGIDSYMTTQNIDTRFCGLYYGYYLDSDTGKTLGAMLKIHKNGCQLNAVLVMRLQSDNMLFSQDLIDRMREDTFSLQSFNEYRSTLSASEESCYLLSGTVEIADNTLLVHFKGSKPVVRQLSLVLNIEKFRKEYTYPYRSGMAFVMNTIDSVYQTQFYMMGLLSVDFNRRINLDEPTLKEHLAIPDTANETIPLDYLTDRKWYKYIIDDRFLLKPEA